ncbi:MAG: DNA adenine methylase [Candidatus Pacebacteria bacterium]|nr:DNA adenine methylase [Candidatus Paceibacterota bacterium]
MNIMPETIHQPVKPLSALVAYVGGKRLLAPQIVAAIEARPHHSYIEPFSGMGSIFLARRTQPKVEVINDRSDDVVNLYRIVKHHPTEFKRHLRYSLTARADFVAALDINPIGLTDIQRAVRFYYLQRLVFGGQPRGRTFSLNRQKPDIVASDRFLALVDQVHERLRRVYIENMDWRDCLGYYDKAGSLFYLDPPYFGCEHYYNTRRGEQFFMVNDHTALAAALMALKGDWILSINDAPEIRALYSGRAVITEVTTRYSVNTGKTKPTTVELLISKHR